MIMCVWLNMTEQVSMFSHVFLSEWLITGYVFIIYSQIIKLAQIKSKHLKDQKPKDAKGWTNNQKGLKVTPK
jgi:hypothetical protein